MDEIIKNYCPHKNINKYDEWIKDAREYLIEAKNKGDKLLEDYFRGLLRENVSFKKSSLKDHNKYCLGNLNIFNIKE